jgi:LPS-assembly lipoprotein
MSSFSKITPLVVVAVLLGACGFSSLHGGRTRGEVPPEMALIKIKPINDRIGQQVRNHLLDLVTPQGAPKTPKYILTVTLNSDTRRLAIEKDAFATRANLRLNASFSLRALDPKEVVFSGKTLAVSSYNILNSQFATLMAQKDAKARAVRETAISIQTRLAIFLSDKQTSDKSLDR